ncbi:MAG: pyrroline-5-carboxylate reductase family protein, partial [Verrucomicrobiota bacterium]
MNRVSIGFLGAGKMATALARGVIQAGVVSAGDVIASDPVAAAREAFAQATGARVTGGNAEVVTASDLVVVAVKPDQVVGLLSELSHLWEVSRHLVV